MTNGKKPDDDSQRLVDAAYDDASNEAGENPGVPRSAAHRLAQLGVALCDELDGGGLGGVVLASQDGEDPPDTGRILAMDHSQLVALVAQLRVTRGEPADPGLLGATSDEQLRELARALRPRDRP